VSLYIGYPWEGPRGGRSVTGDPARKVLGLGISLHGGSVGQPGVGPSTGDFEVSLKGALGVECLSLWELCEGNQGEGSLAGDPEGCVEKTLETGISFHRGPIWGTWSSARLPGTWRAI
jgi:hypothetical protein